jgi:hypothetical protein
MRYLASDAGREQILELEARECGLRRRLLGEIAIQPRLCPLSRGSG